jgi:hypothetical protein
MPRLPILGINLVHPINLMLVSWQLQHMSIESLSMV